MDSQYITQALDGAPAEIFGDIRSLLARARVPAQTIIKLVHEFTPQGGRREVVDAYIGDILARRTDGVDTWHFTGMPESPDRVTTYHRSTPDGYAWRVRAWDTLLLVEPQTPVELNPLIERLSLEQLLPELDDALGRFYDAGIIRERRRETLSGQWRNEVLSSATKGRLFEFVESVGAYPIPRSEGDEQSEPYQACCDVVRLGHELSRVLSGRLPMRTPDYDTYITQLHAEMERVHEEVNA